MASRTINLGTLAVTDTRLIIGDANYPPVGTEIRNVPNGTYPITATVASAPGGERIESFEIAFNGGGSEAEVVTFSIDGGVVAVANPAVDVPKKFIERWRRRRAVIGQLMRGLKGVPPRLHYDTFASASGTPWAVVFYSGDGIYNVHVVRKDGWATRLRCALNAK